MAERGKRGFASMDENKQRAIASMGGRAAHAQGRAHEFSEEEARAAGRKGGQAVREKYGPEFYANIGRAGGGARRARRQQAENAANPAGDSPAASAPQRGVTSQVSGARAGDVANKPPDAPRNTSASRAGNGTRASAAQLAEMQSAQRHVAGA